MDVDPGGVVPAEEYEALRHGVGAIETERDVVSVTGPDATEFLQGQLSQDLGSIPVGEAAPALLLQPTGKMVAVLSLNHVGGEEWHLAVSTGWGDHVLASLARFKLRTDCELELRRVPAVALRGPASSDVAVAGAVSVAPVTWGGIPGLDLLGEALSIPGDAVVCSHASLEVLRIEAGVAAMGAEIDEATIPAEAGVVEGAVSFTKGCFTGQELVARIDSRGSNTPRRLRGLIFGPDDGEPAVGEALLDAEGTEVGRLTSVAYSPGHDATVALAYLRRGVEPGDEVSCGASRARVRELPMFPDA